MSDCWERGRPVRTEREARNRRLFSVSGITRLRPDADEDVRAPRIDRPHAPSIEPLAKR